MELSEIKSKIKDRSEWVLPPFQREYVWNEESKIIDFMESVFSKWPIGSIILWGPNPKDPDIIKKRKLRTESKGEPWYPQEYILDGQQRITTLLRILNNESFVFRDKNKNMCYDFSSRKFVFSEENKLSENLVLLKDVFDLSHSEIKEKIELEKIKYDIDYIIDKIKKIKEYPVQIQKTPEKTSLKDAQELFIRLNTGGKQLPSVDLALSYISLLWDESRDEFVKFRDSLKPTGFYFDFDFYIRCLSAISLKQSLTKKLIKSFDAETVQKDWIKTRDGIEKTIDFLKTTLNLSSNLFLEAENSLVPIVLLFSEKENKIKDKMNALAYWFVIAYLNQRFSGQSTTVLNNDIKTILKSEDPIEELIKNLKEDRSIFNTEPINIKGRQFKFILYILYKDIKTKDFVSGFGIDSLTASPSNKLDFHHIFANSILKNSKFKDRKEDIANKTFLTNKSNKTLSNAEPTYLSNYPENLLQAHLIPPDKSLRDLNKYEEFLQKRKILISNALNKFLNELYKRE